MKLTAMQKRNERRQRGGGSVDMNLVSLIDVFTILIFFLLANSLDPEVLAGGDAVKLPESTAQTVPRETVVVVVDANDILVGGRKLLSVAEALQGEGDLIAPLQAALEQALRERPGLRPVALAAAGGAGASAAPGPAITILGDRELPYRLLRKVMATAARANFTDVSFGVRPRVQS